MAVVFTKDGLATFIEEWRIMTRSSHSDSGLRAFTYENMCQFLGHSCSLD